VILGGGSGSPETELEDLADLEGGGERVGERVAPLVELSDEGGERLGVGALADHVGRVDPGGLEGVLEEADVDAVGERGLARSASTLASLALSASRSFFRRIARLTRSICGAVIRRP
jgi:hypothetical protein